MDRARQRCSPADAELITTWGNRWGKARKLRRGDSGGQLRDAERLAVDGRGVRHPGRSSQLRTKGDTREDRRRAGVFGAGVRVRRLSDTIPSHEQPAQQLAGLAADARPC